MRLLLVVAGVIALGAYMVIDCAEEYIQIIRTHMVHGHAESGRGGTALFWIKARLR